MSQLDIYRNTVTKKKEELAKLNGELSKEQAKIAPLQKKIISANTRNCGMKQFMCYHTMPILTQILLKNQMKN